MHSLLIILFHRRHVLSPLLTVFVYTSSPLPSYLSLNPHYTADWDMTTVTIRFAISIVVKILTMYLLTIPTFKKIMKSVFGELIRLGAMKEMPSEEALGDIWTYFKAKNIWFVVSVLWVIGSLVENLTTLQVGIRAKSLSP